MARAGLGTSVVSSRASASHFLRPPFIIRTSLWPYSFICHSAQAANQLLLSPYRTTVVSLPMPASAISASNLSLGMTSRRTVSHSCVVQFQPIAPGTWPCS